MKKVEKLWIKKIVKKVKTIYKNGWKIIKFDEIEIERYKFHQHKIPILTNDIDINEIVVSNKVPFGKEDFKYFTGYKDVEKIRPLYILCPEWVYVEEILIKLNVCIFW